MQNLNRVIKRGEYCPDYDDQHLIAAAENSRKAFINLGVADLRAEYERIQSFGIAGNLTSIIKQYANPTELTAELLNTLIEKIVIHEATNENGVREQNIDIYYRFIGKIE